MSNTDQLRGAKSVRTLALALLALLLALPDVWPVAHGQNPPALSAEAKPSDSRPYEDYAYAPYKSPADGVELLYKAIKEEIRDPTTGKDDAFSVSHQEILTFLAGLMGERAQKAREGELKLRQLLASETNPEIKDLLQIALGHFGDKTVWRELVRIMKQEGRSIIRERAAKTLSPYDLNVKLAIPDLIEALKDTDVIMDHFPVGPGTGGPTVKSPAFRVRNMAAAVLQWFGVQVEGYPKAKFFEYEVEKASAVKALKPELQDKDKEHVKQAIEAIARVGGPAAKAELQGFIQEQERLPATNEIVSKAKEALSCMEAAQKEPVRAVKGVEGIELDESHIIGMLVGTLGGNQEAVFFALDFVAQGWGKDAKPDLERFIAENSGKPGRSALVTKARELLSRIKP